MAGRLERHAMHAACYAEVIAAMVAGPTSVAELVEVSGLHENTVRKLVNALHRRHVVHVAAWQCRAPLYTFGAKKDAPRPPQLTASEVGKRMRAKAAAIKAIQMTAGPVHA